MPHVPGVEHEFVDARGLRMHVASAGAKTGDPLLLLHGWPQHWYAYRHVIPAFAQAGYRVIVPDLRGWGWTDAPDSGYEKRQMAQDVLNLTDALGIRSNLRMIGHDWGSFLGFLVCRARPDLVMRYVALAAFHFWPKISLESALAIRLFWYQGVVATPVLGPQATANERFMREIYRLWTPNHDVWNDAELDALIAQFREPARARASSRVYRLWLTRELPRLIIGRYAKPTLNTPTLFMHGAQDGCIHPSYFRHSPRLAPNMTVELLEGIGHFVPEEAPELVIKRSLAHFAET